MGWKVPNVHMDIGFLIYQIFEMLQTLIYLCFNLVLGPTVGLSAG